jgi:hypothetical protein
MMRGVLHASLFLDPNQRAEHLRFCSWRECLAVVDDFLGIGVSTEKQMVRRTTSRDASPRSAALS